MNDKNYKHRQFAAYSFIISTLCTLKFPLLQKADQGRRRKGQWDRNEEPKASSSIFLEQIKTKIQEREEFAQIVNSTAA